MSDDTLDSAAILGTSVKGESKSYRILSEIGAGGMGSVYLAETEGTGRKVAVKFLHAELSADGDSSRERFEREMRVLQDLKAFRGIVQYEDGGQIENGQMFLVMEFVQAPTLDKIIADNANGLKQIRAIQIVVEILSVLEPIHHRRFVHRDLKPHNICVYENPLAVRLLDFGLSKPYQEGLGYEKVTRKMQGKGSEIPGSPHYMAVEQFLRPKDVDARTDLYSCGIILYELLAGIPPFRGIYLQDILQQHKENPPPPIDTCADGGAISYRLWEVLKKALAKDGKSRYQSAGEFKEALFDVLNVLNKRDRPKKSLDDTYRMIKKIGVGGNSEVFEVEAKDGGERFALKIAREGASDWDEETLMNEADRALKHENIVQIHEFGTFQGRPALAMELMEAGSLEDIIESGEQQEGMAENVFYRTMIDICRGLHHAHQKNIVHRDVKPGNMLRNKEGRTKVCDFGIAKRFEQKGDEMTGGKNTTMAKGTAQYISPEQCDLQGRVDRRADIYCLGVMMYEMLAGELPFTDGILIMQHLQSNPPPLLVKGSFRNPDALCKIVEKAMHKSPANRYQSMKELAQDIVRVSKLEPQANKHKAVPLQTIPEDWEKEVGGAADRNTGQTRAMAPVETGMSGKKVALIVSSVVVALVAVFAFINSQNSDTPVPPPANLTGDDPLVAEYDAVKAKIAGSDYAGITPATFDLLEAGSDRRAELASLILAQLGTDVFAIQVDDKNAASLLGKTTEALEAIKATDDGAVGSNEVQNFAQAARNFLAATEVSEGQWKVLEADAEKPLVDSLKQLQAVNSRFSPSFWHSFVVSRKEKLWNNSLSATAIALEKLGPTWTSTIDEQVQTLLQENPDYGKTLFPAIESWVSRQIKSAENLGQLTSLLTDACLKAAGVTPAAADQVSGVAAMKKADSFIANGFEARDRRIAVSIGLARIRKDAVFQGKMAMWFAKDLGFDPLQWPENLDTVAKSGLPLDMFATAVLNGLEETIKGPEFKANLERVMASLDDKGQNSEAAQHDRARDRVLSLVKTQSTDQIAEGFMGAWSAMYGPYRRDAGAVWASLDSLVKNIGDQPKVSEIFAVTKQLVDFLNDYQDDQATYKSKVGVHVEAMRVKLAARAHPLVQIGFLEVFGKSLPYDLNLQKRALEASLSANLLGTGSRAKPTFVDGAAVKFVNRAWINSSVKCVRIPLPLAQGIVDLVSDGTIKIAGVGNIDAEVSDNGKTLVVIGAPKDLYSPSRGQSGGDLTLGANISIEAPQWGLSGEEVALTFSGPKAGSYDFDVPSIEINGKPARQGKVALEIRVDDANPGNGQPVVTIGGQVIAVSGKAPLFIAQVSLGKEVFGISAKRDAVTVRFEDDFGNKAERNDDEWLAVIAEARTSLAEEAMSEVRPTFERKSRKTSGKISRRGLREAKAALDEAHSTLTGLQAYTARGIDRTAGEVLSAASQLSQTWDATGLKSTELIPLESDLSEFFQSLKNMASLAKKSVGVTQPALWAKLKKQAAGAAPVVANPDGGKPVRPINRGPDYSSYKKDALQSALGIRFHRVVVGPTNKPVWIAEVEVSQGFATRFDGGAAKKQAKKNARGDGEKVRSRDNLPLSPMTPNMAKALVNQINSSSEAGQLQAIFGGPVRVAIPTEQAWNKAGELQTKGAGGYAFGGNRVPSKYRNKNFRQGKKKWYEALQPVDSENSSPFKFLSGNVSEIVRTAAKGFGLKGGSVSDASYSLKYKALEVGTRSTNISAGKHALLSGLRLAIVPIR